MAIYAVCPIDTPEKFRKRSTFFIYTGKFHPKMLMFGDVGQVARVMDTGKFLDSL